MKASLALIALAALLAAAPLAAAQESNETKTEEQSEPQDGGNAWTEDCPPDMMCAYGGSASEEPTEPKEDENATRGPEDCEYCRGGDTPTSNESEVQDGGQAWVDNCPEGMMCAADSGNGTEPIPYGSEGCIECSGPPVGADDANGAPQPTSSENDVAQTDATQKSVPGFGILAVAGAFAAVAVVALARRS